MNIVDKVAEARSTNKFSNTEEMHDVIKVRGHVNIQVEENGVTTEHFDGPNLIVSGAKKIMSFLIAQAPSTCTITQLRIGKDPQYTTPPLSVSEPLLTDTALVGELVTVDADDPAFTYKPSATAATSVEFSFVLDYADGNGSGAEYYTEAGLFIVGGEVTPPGNAGGGDFGSTKRMFARETFPALIKNSNRKVTFKWTIAF